MTGSVLTMLGSPLSWSDLGAMVLHFGLLSLLAVGGAISTAPDMHRFIVDEHSWLTDAQFSASVALAQAAPGPNVLFVAVIGWNVAGAIGMLACMIGTLVPSTVLALYATRWGDARRDTMSVRSFTLGMAPVTIGLTAATGWILATPATEHWSGLIVVAVATLVSFKTKITPVVLIAAGAVIGALGLV
jgi:chromate transporter